MQWGGQSEIELWLPGGRRRRTGARWEDKVTSMFPTRFHLKDKAVWEHIHKCRFWMEDSCYIIVFLCFKPFPQNKIIVVHQDCFLHAQASGAWWSARVWRTIHSVVLGLPHLFVRGAFWVCLPLKFSPWWEKPFHVPYFGSGERQRAGAMEGKLQGTHKSNTVCGLGWWLGDRRWTSRGLKLCFWLSHPHAWG